MTPRLDTRSAGELSDFPLAAKRAAADNYRLLLAAKSLRRFHRFFPWLVALTLFLALMISAA